VVVDPEFRGALNVAGDRMPLVAMGAIVRLGHGNGLLLDGNGRQVVQVDEQAGALGRADDERQLEPAAGLADVDPDAAGGDLGLTPRDDTGALDEGRPRVGVEHPHPATDEGAHDPVLDEQDDQVGDAVQATRRELAHESAHRGGADDVLPQVVDELAGLTGLGVQHHERTGAGQHEPRAGPVGDSPATEPGVGEVPGLCVRGVVDLVSHASWSFHRLHRLSGLSSL